MIDSDLLKPIIDELNSNSLPISNYRQRSSPSKQSVFGIASRRGQPADYSKLCASHPATYKLLMELGEACEVGIYSSILVSEGPPTIKVKSASNIAWIISCGDEGQGGTLTEITTPTIKFSEPTTKFTFVFYTAPNSTWLPAPSVVAHNGTLVFKRGDDLVFPGARRSKKTTMGMWIERRPVEIYFP